MPPTTPYVQHTRQVTARLRARMHAQSFANTFCESATTDELAAGRVADARLENIMALQKEHRRTLEPRLKEKALSLLTTLPLKSSTDDPKFAYTLNALRLCSYFSITHSDTTFKLLNHLTRHSFLLDALAIWKLVRSLQDLHHPQTAEVLTLVLPRTVEVALSFTNDEARYVLAAYADHQLLTPALSEKLVSVLIGAVNDTPVVGLARNVEMLVLIGDAAGARRYLTAATPRICSVYREVSDAHCVYETQFLQGADASAVAGPGLPPPPPPLPAAGVALCDETTKGQAGSDKSREETPTQRTLRRRQEEEWRLFLIDQIRRGHQLLQMVTRCITTFSWAPRRLLTETVCVSMWWSEPLLVGAAATEQDAVDMAVAEEDLFVRDLPRLLRRNICFCVSMLHHTSFRHPAALRHLTARVAALRKEVCTTSSSTVARELTLVVEAVAFFDATDCAAAVTEIVADVEACIAPSLSGAELAHPASALPVDTVKVVEGVLLRLLASCARLIAAHMDSTPGESARTAQQAAIRALVSQTVRLAASPVSRLYLDTELQRSSTRALRPVPAELRVQSMTHTVHLFYATTVALVASTVAELAPSEAQASDLQHLQRNHQLLLPWAQRFQLEKADELADETAQVLRQALALSAAHPEHSLRKAETAGDDV